MNSRTEIHRHSPARPWTYADLDLHQRAIRAAIARGEPGRLLIAELAPVITLGRRETREDLRESAAALAARGVNVATVSRGGRATYHGPGQWVVFPVESLERLTGDRRGVRRLVDGLLGTARELCALRFPRAEVRAGAEAGVWTEPGPTGAKLAALGVKIDGGIVQHGLAINVHRTPESFVGLRPCGLDLPVGFLEAAPSEAAFVAWGERIALAFAARFPAFRG